MVRPIIMNACETWTLKEAKKQKLLLFKRKIIRKIIASTKEPNGLWRIKQIKKYTE